MGLGKISYLATLYISTIVLVHYIGIKTHSCSCMSDYLLGGFQLDQSNPASKFTLLRIVFSRLSLFVFLHTMIVMLIRIFTGRGSPSTQQDPTQIVLINRIITNTIQQSFIFLGLYAYFLYDLSEGRISSIQITNIANWFILGRILFSIGYILGTIFKIPQIRAPGMGLNMMSIVILIEFVFSPRQPIFKFLTSF